MSFYVYVYLREDGSPYYVGKGSNGRWCNKNHRVEVPPPDRVIFPIKDITEEWAHFMEMEFIDQHGRLNDGTGILENLTDGGEGTSGKVTSEATKQKISEANKGKLRSEETKRRISTACLGKKRPQRSEEHRDKISAHRRGKRHTEETKQKIREIKTGVCVGSHTDETKQKISEANKGKPRRPLSEEQKRKISEALKGRKCSTEHKRKVSAALKNYYVDKGDGKKLV